MHEKQRDKEREIDVEPSQEYDEYERFERRRRAKDKRTFGEPTDDDFEGDYVPDDPGEYENG